MKSGPQLFLPGHSFVYQGHMIKFKEITSFLHILVITLVYAINGGDNYDAWLGCWRIWNGNLDDG